MQNTTPVLRLLYTLTAALCLAGWLGSCVSPGAEPDELQSLQSRIDELESHKSLLENELAINAEKLTKLGQDLNKLQTDNDAKQSTIAGLQEKISKLEKTLEELRDLQLASLGKALPGTATNQSGTTMALPGPTVPPKTPEAPLKLETTLPQAVTALPSADNNRFSRATVPGTRIVKDSLRSGFILSHANATIMNSASGLEIHATSAGSSLYLFLQVRHDNALVLEANRNLQISEGTGTVLYHTRPASYSAWVLGNDYMERWVYPVDSHCLDYLARSIRGSGWGLQVEGNPQSMVALNTPLQTALSEMIEAWYQLY